MISQKEPKPDIGERKKAKMGIFKAGIAYRIK
jgi:hypothetical protein